MKRFLLLLPLLVLLAPAPTRGQGSSRAGVVVKFGDGSVQTSCVSFATDTISGLELLRGSGLDVIAQSVGNNAAVCKIGGDGCNYPAESCLGCRFGAGGQGEYWAYWQLVEGAWRYGQQGAGVTRIRNGAVDGWAYGPGNVQTGAQPPAITFDEICPTAPPPEPTAVPPTAVPPTAVPPTPRPTIRPTIPPTAIPTTRPTVASTIAPTVEPMPEPTATPTEAIVAAAPSATSTSAATATDVPATATARPTNTPEPSPTQPAATATAEPTATALPAGAASPPAPSSNTTGYLVFAAMLVAIVGAIGVAAQRRRR